MKVKIMILGLICLFFISGCENAYEEILPVGQVEIFLDNISFQEDEATISLRFKEVMGVESLVMCLMVHFMKDGVFLESGYFTPDILIPRYGEISYIQEMLATGNYPLTGAYKEADILRTIIQLQTEFFKGFSESKDFNIKIGV